MYVCICNAVTHDDITEAVQAGAGCVRTICTATRAASACGTCFHRVRDAAAEALMRCLDPQPLVGSP
jgi:bacterioferritin-associated ferredoxin